MSYEQPDIDALLPLQPTTFHILMSLAGGETHGYAIIQDVAERTDGSLRLGAGTLYRTLHRLLEQGLVVESLRRPARAIDDERRRYYRLTAFGRAVARAETERLLRLVHWARRHGLTPGRV